MMNKPLTLPIIADSGAPEGSADYTTVVLFHAYAWTSEAFRKMLPLAKAFNARLILANRRDYVGAAPFTIQERTELFTAASVAQTEPEAARMNTLAWMRERAREVYDLLVHIVGEHGIPLACPEANTGGIVVGGWSFGTTLMTALLANMASFPVGDVDLPKYLRRVVFLDPPDFALGFAPLSPMLDSTKALRPGTRYSDLLRDFSLFYSAYFKHGDIDNPDTYETHNPLADPAPTWHTLTPEEVEAIYDPVPGDVRGGMDSTLMSAGMSVGAFGALREAALRLPEGKGLAPEAESWDAVEVRHVWGDHSVAAMMWAMHALRAELEKEKKAGTRVRNVKFARVEGGNHIMPWDLPERTLDAILRT
ncbi:hypothetical protein LXA43DRAFT_595463 [Ganoderma leucocontextum]|nr:hypothetical protein LXA43DRAFT_595463 [Ganoderma leucocontextum]